MISVIAPFAARSPAAMELVMCNHHVYGFRDTRALFHYPQRRLIVRSHKVSKSRDSYLNLSDRSDIWQAHRQHCCRGVRLISKRSDDLNYQSGGFETLRDLTIRRLIRYWNRAQISIATAGSEKSNDTECIRMSLLFLAIVQIYLI